MGVEPLPVAENVMGESPLTVAVTLFVPGVTPRVQLVSRAIPSEPVATVEGVTAPVPAVTANATLTPCIGFPF